MSDDEAPELVAVEDEVENGEHVVEQKKIESPVPVCILTGWLGAGKTTLLTRLVKEYGYSGKQIAIIQNEASALGVEEALVLQDDSGLFGEMLELGNGCVCCSVRADFALAVEALMRKKRFDYIFVECSGLADPGPLAKMFWVDEELESNIYLDSIVALVDANYLESHLANGQPQSKQVVRQIAFADVIVLNKRDLVTAEAAQRMEKTLSQLNAGAKICTTTRSAVQLSEILHIKGFESQNAARVASSKLLPADTHTHSDGHSTDHCHDHSHSPDATCSACSDQASSATSDAHVHDTSITSTVLTVLGRVDERAVTKWLAMLLWKEKYISVAEMKEQLAQTDLQAQGVQVPEESKGMEIFRMKGIFRVQGEEDPYFLQGVGEVFEFAASEGGGGDGKVNDLENRVVVIGRNLDKTLLQQGLEKCLV